MTCMRCTTPSKCAVWGCVPGTFPSKHSYDQMAADLADGTPKILAALDKLIANGMPFAPMAASTSTVPSTPPSTLTLEKLEAAIGAIPPEPIGEWMREQGFPPETSLVILPEMMRPQLPIWPSYVRFSTHVGKPHLCRDLLGHAGSLGVWDDGR